MLFKIHPICTYRKYEKIILRIVDDDAQDGPVENNCYQEHQNYSNLQRSSLVSKFQMERSITQRLTHFFFTIRMMTMLPVTMRRKRLISGK